MSDTWQIVIFKAILCTVEGSIVENTGTGGLFEMWRKIEAIQCNGNLFHGEACRYFILFYFFIIDTVFTPLNGYFFRLCWYFPVFLSCSPLYWPVL